jgi:two-component system, OmpR family, sensor histidine kinase KdpD
MRWPSPLRSLPLRRTLAGYALAAVLAPLLTFLLASLRGQLNLALDALAFLVAVIAVALAGGLVPALLEAIAGSLLLSFYFTPPVHQFTIGQASSAAALGALVAVAVVVSLLANSAARRTRQAGRAIVEAELLATAAACIVDSQQGPAAVLDRAREALGMQSVTLLERSHSAIAAALKQQRLAASAEAARAALEADRARAALLAAVSHDLRTPLAAARAAVSCLRSGDIQLTAEDHDELLATAEESLDLLTHLVTSLLDVSRLQAGALPVFPRPADLQEIITRSLDDIGPQARAVMRSIPPELPQVMVDPPIMERVIANVTANALRYSPGGSPPLLTARAHGDWVELRVVDRGPGVPETDRDRMFVPFQRLGDTGSSTGVGLGLAVSRGLTEAMRGTLEPEETPDGGLTMAISVPAAPGPSQTYPAHLANTSANRPDRPDAEPRPRRRPGLPRR